MQIVLFVKDALEDEVGNGSVLEPERRMAHGEVRRGHASEE